MTTPIQASALRIGMFVHLNVGWMSHPFPLSSFKLTSNEQIETIRSLGLSRLTWSPERSDVEQPVAETAAAAEGDVADGAPAEEHAAPKPLDARQLARLALQAQMEIAQRCERQLKFTSCVSSWPSLPLCHGNIAPRKPADRAAARASSSRR